MSNIPNVQTMENKEAVVNIKAAASVAQAAAQSKANPLADLPTDVVAKLLEQFKELKATNEALAAKVAASSPAAPSKKTSPPQIDWSKVSEADIFTMDIPVPTIEHALETYLDVYLADKNFVARWVHKNQHNIGPKLNAGYTFVTKEDLDPNKAHALLFDTNGHYSFDDVICLKIPKQIYFAKIKANFNRATSVQRGKEVRQRQSNQDINVEAISDNPYVNAAQQRGSLQFYEPSAPSLTVAQQVG
jgi:hypothetical protein